MESIGGKGTNRKMKWKGTLREFWTEKRGRLKDRGKEEDRRRGKKRKKIIIKFLKPIISLEISFKNFIIKLKEG